MYIRQYRTRSGTLRWRCEVQPNGQRQSEVFDTKREAQAWGNQKEAAAKILGRGWRTFAEAVGRYESDYTSKKKAHVWEKNTLARLVAQFGESSSLGSIDKIRIAKWRDERLQSVTGSTVRREANLLRHLFKVAKDEWGWMEQSPFTGVKMPAENAPRHQIWRWQLIKRVLRSDRTGKIAEMQLAFHIALRTGMRLSEVLKAPAGFDAKRRVVVLGTTKNGRRAEVPIGRVASKLIAKAVFTVEPNEGSTLFSQLCRQLLIPDLTFHDSRATALTLLARKVDVMTLAKISRHKDLKILLNAYYRESADDIAARI